MATVYLAHHARHTRKVSITVMHADLADRVGPERFLTDLRSGTSEAPTMLFAGPYLDNPGWTRPRSYDASRDGERFLMVRPAGGQPLPRISVVLNWFDELRAKVPR
jgi:hypothetical protein